MFTGLQSKSPLRRNIWQDSEYVFCVYVFCFSSHAAWDEPSFPSRYNTTLPTDYYVSIILAVPGMKYAIQTSGLLFWLRPATPPHLSHTRRLTMACSLCSFLSLSFFYFPTHEKTSKARHPTHKETTPKQFFLLGELLLLLFYPLSLPGGPAHSHMLSAEEAYLRQIENYLLY